MESKVIRQGDVLLKLEKIDSLPKEAQEIKSYKSRIVLAYGEVTGHAHAIYEDTDKVKVWAIGMVKYIEVMAGAIVTSKIVSKIVGEDGKLFEVGEQKIPGVALKHEEHTAHLITPGIYKLPVQVEYHPAELRITID